MKERLPVRRFGRTIAWRAFHETGRTTGYVVIKGTKWRVRKVVKPTGTHLQFLGVKKR